LFLITARIGRPPASAAKEVALALSAAVSTWIHGSEPLRACWARSAAEANVGRGVSAPKPALAAADKNVRRVGVMAASYVGPTGKRHRGMRRPMSEMMTHGDNA
jgi:hypothetical protein